MQYFVTYNTFFMRGRLIYRFDGKFVFARWEFDDNEWGSIPNFDIKEKLKNKYIEKIPKAEVALILGFGL